MPQDPYELPCNELVELLTDYIENRLSDFDQERFKRHLAICDPCVDYLNQFRQTIKAVGKLREEDISPKAKQTLLDAFRGWKASGGTLNALKFLLLAELANLSFDVPSLAIYRVVEAAHFVF
jgi:hypothetical protein